MPDGESDLSGEPVYVCQECGASVETLQQGMECPDCGGLLQTTGDAHE